MSGEVVPDGPDDIDLGGASSSDIVEYIRPESTPRPPSERGVNLTTGQVLQYEPMTSLEVQYAIEEIQAALDRFAAVFPLLKHEEYAAERAYITKKANARITAPAGGYDRDRAAYAELEAMPEMEAWHEAKEKRAAAEKLADALKTKLYGYLNLNKAITAHMQTFGGGTSHRT